MAARARSSKKNSRSDQVVSVCESQSDTVNLSSVFSLTMLGSGRAGNLGKSHHETCKWAYLKSNRQNGPHFRTLAVSNARSHSGFLQFMRKFLQSSAVNPVRPYTSGRLGFSCSGGLQRRRQA